MEVTPETRYAKTSDGVHVAYQIVGDGPHDLVWTGALFQNIELNWRFPPLASFLRHLASSARLLIYDPRGTGASDRIFEGRLPTLEGRMADAVAVMDAAGSERATIFGFDATGPVAILTAATFPERTAAIILYGTEPCGLWRPDYPWGWTEDKWEQQLADTESRWGRDDFLAELHDWLAPSASADVEFKREMASFFRLAASPAGAVALAKMERDTDVRHILPTIHVPTLVLHRTGDQAYPVEAARYTAERIAGAKYVELPGEDHVPWFGDSNAIVREIRAFLASVRVEEAEMDRALATVLFTDIVDSTEKAAGLGDREWRNLLDRHHQVVRAYLARHRGREVDTAGDGFLATFDGPARAVRCARSIAEAVLPLGIQIRAGCHTGEIELDGDSVRGIAVHIGARVAALAGPSEVWTSSTVKDLTAGSGLVFEDAGEHELKGVPGRWRLYRVVT